MNTPCSSKICILLVGGNAANVASLSLLLKSKYNVMTAQTGSDALCILVNPPHDVDLVMVSTGLPDICSFEFIKMVDKQVHLPAVIICESHDPTTLSRASSSGALGAFVHPLSSEDIIDLWQLPGLKKVMVKLDESKARQAVEQSKKKNKKIDGGSVGQSSALPASDVRYLVPVNIVQFNLGKAMFSVGAHRVYAPVVTCDWKLFAERRLEQFRAHLKQQQVGLVPMSNQLPMAAKPPNSDSDSSDDYEVLSDESNGPSFLAKYLENPYSRAQLRWVIKVAMLKWGGQPGTSMDIPPQPTPPSSDVPPVSLPASVALCIENFIHTMNAFKYLPDGNGAPALMHQMAADVGSSGPSGSSMLPEGGEELDLDLDEVDTNDIYDAIKELWDENF